MPLSPSPPDRSVFLVDPRSIADGMLPLAHCAFEAIEEGFRTQSASSHTLASSPDAADLILAPIQHGGYGPALERLRASKFYAQHRRKVLVYGSDDNQFPAIPGLYPSMGPSWKSRTWAVPAHYLSSHIHKSLILRPDELLEKDIDFSFVGSSRTHRVRSRIMRLASRAAYLFDASGPKDEHWWAKRDAAEAVDRYRDALRRSKFVICPRGMSPSSIRLFECMEAACVPIIVADALQLPTGPDWARFALTVPEKRVEDIPALVERRKGDAAEMGRLARQAWEAFFSPGATANSLVRWATELLEKRRGRSLAWDARIVRVHEYSSWPLFKSKVRSRMAARSNGRR